MTTNAGSLVQSAINDLVSQGAGALVLDLRDNPGGYLTQAVGVASLFMSSGTVVEVQTIDGISPKAATGRTAKRGQALRPPPGLPPPPYRSGA